MVPNDVFIVVDGLVSFWNGSAMTEFQILPQILSGETEENHEKSQSG